MNELARLASVLHSLRVKLHVAQQSNHPKVFMWSSPWEPTTSTNFLLPTDTDFPTGSADFAGPESADFAGNGNADDLIDIFSSEGGKSFAPSVSDRQTDKCEDNLLLGKLIADCRQVMKNNQDGETTDNHQQTTDNRQQTTDKQTTDKKQVTFNCETN